MEDRDTGDTDDAGGDGRPRAANELTITEWDPVSKQPLFKVAAVRVDKLADAPAPGTTTGGQGVRETTETTDRSRA